MKQLSLSQHREINRAKGACNKECGFNTENAREAPHRGGVRGVWLQHRDYKGSSPLRRGKGGVASTQRIQGKLPTEKG
jgi:hypothetical protein